MSPVTPVTHTPDITSYGTIAVTHIPDKVVFSDARYLCEQGRLTNDDMSVVVSAVAVEGAAQTLHVQGLPRDVREEPLLLYLESKISGDGLIQRVDIQDNMAVITFETAEGTILINLIYILIMSAQIVPFDDNVS